MAAAATGACRWARTVRVGAFRGRAETDGRGAVSWTLELVREELAKLTRARMLPALVLLCLALNAALIFGHLWLRPALMEVAAVAEVAGVQVDDMFIAVLAARPEREESRRLLASVEQMDAGSIFEHAEKSASHEAEIADTDIAAACLSAKYDAWLERASRVSQTGATSDVYAGAVTRDAHDIIFGTLVPALVIEVSLVGVACVWYLADLDVHTGARSVVLATACGRSAAKPRLAASLIGMLGTYAALATVTLVAVAFALGWGGGARVGQQCFERVQRCGVGIVGAPVHPMGGLLGRDVPVRLSCPRSGGGGRVCAHGACLAARLRHACHMVGCHLRHLRACAASAVQVLHGAGPLDGGGAIFRLPRHVAQVGVPVVH